MRRARISANSGNFSVSSKVVNVTLRPKPTVLVARNDLKRWRGGRVQSCVRPVDAVIVTAGLDGFRGSGPILLCGLICPGRLAGCPYPRSDRFAITSHRPRNR